MPIELQIKVLAIAFVLAVMYVCYLTWKLGRFMRGVAGQAGFSKVEIAAWLIMLGYRLYGLLWGLTEQIEQLRAAGIIKEHLNLNQWINVGGNLLFITMMIISKQKELRAVRRAWGPESEEAGGKGETVEDPKKTNKGPELNESTTGSTDPAPGTTGDRESGGDGGDRGGVGSSPGDKPKDPPPGSGSGS